MRKSSWVITTAECEFCDEPQTLKIHMPAWKRSPYLFDCRSCEKQNRLNGVEVVLEMGCQSPPPEAVEAIEVGVWVASRPQQQKTLDIRNPHSLFIDVTSKGEEPWVRFSPFWPHGGIPVPFSPGRTAESVEGIWQALKVFEPGGINELALDNNSIKDNLRTMRRFGNCRGYQKGIDSIELLSYLDARRHIYLPSYRWVLDNCLQDELAQLRVLSESQKVVLLDDESNADIEDHRGQLSHAALVAMYLRDEWPD